MYRVIDKLETVFLKYSVSKKIIAGIFIALFCLSLAPIIITMFYSVPVLDDYTFGCSTHLSVVNGDSFWSGVFTSCSRFYSEWQGFFTSNFIASSQPYTIDVNLYFISNLMFFAVFVSSLFYFSKAILINVLKSNVIDYLLITIPVIETIIQFLPSAAEGIYWMDGSLSLLMTGVFLFFISFVLLFYKASNKTAKIIYAVLSLICTVALSGAGIMDYVTFILLFVFSLLYLIKKKSSVLWFTIAIFVVYTIGMVISLTAPGNQVRINTDFSNNRTSFFSAIFYAVFYSMVEFGKWFNLCFVVLLIFASVMFWNIAKKSNYQFNNPLLVFIICYGVYSGRMSVQLYAGGYLGAARQMNLYYISFIICMVLAWLYFIGWVSKRKATKTIKVNCRKFNLAFIFIICVLLVMGAFGFGTKKLTSVSTGLSLVNGQTQQYNNEMKERIAIYEDDSIKAVEVSPLSVYPSFFTDESLTDNPNYWTNSAIATYYNKKSVVLKK